METPSASEAAEQWASKAREVLPALAEERQKHGPPATDPYLRAWERFDGRAEDAWRAYREQSAAAWARYRSALMSIETEYMAEAAEIRRLYDEKGQARGTAA